MRLKAQRLSAALLSSACTTIRSSPLAGDAGRWMSYNSPYKLTDYLSCSGASGCRTRRIRPRCGSVILDPSCTYSSDYGWSEFTEELKATSYHMFVDYSTTGAMAK